MAVRRALFAASVTFALASSACTEANEAAPSGQPQALLAGEKITRTWRDHVPSNAARTGVTTWDILQVETAAKAFVVIQAYGPAPAAHPTDRGLLFEFVVVNGKLFARGARGLSAPAAADYKIPEATQRVMGGELRALLLNLDDEMGSAGAASGQVTVGTCGLGLAKGAATVVAGALVGFVSEIVIGVDALVCIATAGQGCSDLEPLVKESAGLVMSLGEITYRAADNGCRLGIAPGAARAPQ